MQPKLIVRYDSGRPDDPNAWPALFHQNLPAGEFLAERDLAVRANHFYAGFDIRSIHKPSASQGDRHRPSAIVPDDSHDCTLTWCKRCHNEGAEQPFRFGAIAAQCVLSRTRSSRADARSITVHYGILRNYGLVRNIP
jgi:hypothetical protein